jgi:hypothetical protein
MSTEAVVESRRDNMTTPLWSDVDWFVEDVFARRLRHYVSEVARALGVGPESTTVDPATPASAYLALDGRVPGYPGRDLALLWDERHGWSAAVETHSGEDLVIVSYVDPKHGLVPSPRLLARFVTALRAGDHIGRVDPPDLCGHDRCHLNDLLAVHHHES